MSANGENVRISYVGSHMAVTPLTNCGGARDRLPISIAHLASQALWTLLIYSMAHGNSVQPADCGGHHASYPLRCEDVPFAQSPEGYSLEYGDRDHPSLGRSVVVGELLNAKTVLPG